MGPIRRIRLIAAMNALRICFCLLAIVLCSCNRGHKTCAVCQRDECTGLAFRVTLDNGKTVETCCPRCGLHYVEEAKQSARLMQATDYVTGKWLDAKLATFVSGSDVSHCASKEVRRDAQGCCLVKGYDRCLPSLIAFQSQEEAGKFLKEHGGTMVSFEKIAAN
jgi:hypothetical protein